MKKFLAFLLVIIFLLLINLASATNITLEVAEDWKFDKINELKIIIVDGNFEPITIDRIEYSYMNLEDISINQLNLYKIDIGIYKQQFNILSNLNEKEFEIVVNVVKNNESFNKTISIIVEKQSYFEERYASFKETIKENPYIIILILFVLILLFIFFCVIVIIIISRQ